MQVILSRLFEKERAYKGHKWSFEPIACGELVREGPYDLFNKESFIEWLRDKFGCGVYMLEVPHYARVNGRMRNSLKVALKVNIRPTKRLIRTDRWSELIARNR